MVFGADIIAGFPTETEAMFARSLDLVDECGLTHLHVFPFSPRPGTPAARMPQVPAEVVRERARRLREKGAAGAASVISTARSAGGAACWPKPAAPAAPSSSLRCGFRAGRARGRCST